MGKIMLHHPRHTYNDALWAIVAQFSIVLIGSAVIGGIFTLRAAGSFAAGGLICVLPNIYLYRRVFAHFGARAAKKMLKAFYWGEVAKLIFTAGGFVGALKIAWIIPLWVFSGYIIAQAGFWIAPLMISAMNQEKY